jgi:membrane-bound lytic murein transglycosylase B
MVSRLKKALVSGAIILATVVPGFSQQSKAERYVQVSKIGSFVPPHQYKIAPKEERIAKSLEELSIRLAKDGFDQSSILNLYADNRFRIHRGNANYFKVNPEAKAPTYETYREKLGLEAKVKEGPEFFRKHQFALLDAEDLYGVEASFIAAIIGVETDYGSNPGRYRAFNAAVSLYNSSKKELAYKQLKELLTYADKQNMDIFDIYSSYAVCVGYGQFLPENLSKFFIGKNGDFKADFNSMEDWICSVAYYLQKAGWNKKQNYRTPIKSSTNWKALWVYNHSGHYIRAVVDLASSMRNNSEVKLLREHHEEFKKLGKIFIEN